MRQTIGPRKSQKMARLPVVIPAMVVDARWPWDVSVTFLALLVVADGNGVVMGAIIVDRICCCRVVVASVVVICSVTAAAVV